MGVADDYAEVRRKDGNRLRLSVYVMA